MDKLKKNKPRIVESNKNLNIKKKENLRINLENLQNELKKTKEESLRHLAEIDNLRKRFEKEREDIFKYAIKSKWSIIEMSPYKKNLEDVFRSLTGTEAGNA